MPEVSRRLIFAVGMHRSGTSAVSGALHLLGATHPETPMLPAQDNPKGFFESRKVANLNEHMLTALGGRWDYMPSHVRGLGYTPADIIAWADATFSAEIDRVLRNEFPRDPDFVVVKDPRICFFLPLWEASAKRLGYSVSHIFVFRDPESVARSLWLRNRMDVADAETLWARYNAHALTHLPAGTTILKYETFTKSPDSALEAAGFQLSAVQRSDIVAFATREAEDRSEIYLPRGGTRTNITRLICDLVGDQTQLPPHEERRTTIDRVLHFLRMRDETRGDVFRLGPARKSKPVASGPRKVILHCHLFKNAGTCVDHVLKSSFGDAWNEEEFPKGDSVSNADMVLSHIIANSKFTVFSTHTGNWFLDYDTPRLEVFPIIFLRHPILRVLSAYQFERNQEATTTGSELAKSTDLAGYIQNRLDTPYDYSLTNFQARILAFFVSRRVVDIESQSLDAFKRLAFIGRVEDFATSMERLQSYLQPHFPSFEGFAVQKNVTSVESADVETRLGKVREQIGDALMDRLIAANRIDLKLFDMLEARYTQSL